MFLNICFANIVSENNNKNYRKNFVKGTTDFEYFDSLNKSQQEDGLTDWHDYDDFHFTDITKSQTEKLVVELWTTWVWWCRSNGPCGSHETP